ncbi:tyrosine-type recombinase/integrase [Pseudomonas sp. DWP3-1-2]|uniref:tyrosine-type recombinase/integrase n=1 Tax=Pseudomonas sp. DWP3-1-2 TaxID=2804645 RepID=UPI003CF78D88
MKSSSGQVKKSLKSTTINLRTTVVVDFLKYYLSSSAEGDELHSQKRINSSELTRTRISIRGKYSRPTAISAESCRKLSAKLNSAHRLIFIWAISTGLRVSSILSLKTEVFHSSIEEGGGGFIEVLSKGGKYLKVFLTEYVISETRKYIALERRLLELRSKSSSNSTSPMLFINKHGAAVNYECYYAAYKRACKTLGIKSHPHQTRTTFASFMEKSLREYGKENGLDHIKIIQGLLGHASAQTTMMYLESLSVYNVEVLKLLEVNSRNLGDELALH